MMHLVLFFSWLRTLISFHILGKFKNWDESQIDFIKMSYNPRNSRDKKLMNKIIEFNKKRLKI